MHGASFFGKDASKSHINHHKIAALYMLSFLKHTPFNLDIPEGVMHPELCLLTKLPNEYFVIPFLQAVFRAGTEDIDGVLGIDPTYRDNFIKLLYGYRKGTISLDPASFAYTISLIESCYFIRS